MPPSGRDLLVLLKAERAQVRQRGHLLASPLSAVSMAGIGDHLEIVLSRDLHDAIHISGIAS